MTTAYTKDPAFAPHFERAENLFHDLADATTSPAWRKMQHDEVEELITVRGREVLRCLFEGHMALRGTGKAEEVVVGADQVERSHERESCRHLGTGLGEVAVPRTGYSATGANNLFVVDADLNLPPDKYSLTIRRLAAEYSSRTSFADATELLKMSTAANPGKRQVEQLVHKASVDFEAFYEETRLDVPSEETGEVLVLSFDMKGIVVRTEDLRARTRAAAEEEEAKPVLDKSKDAPKKQRKRMAMVTAVYTVAPWVRTPEVFADILRGETPKGEEHRNRPAPENKRVWASIERKAKKVVEEGFLEALGRDPEQQKTWVVLVDGDPKQLRWIKKAARRFRVNVVIVLDIIHVTQYLWKAGKDLHPEKGQRKALEKWVSRRVLQVLRGEAGLVAGGMRRSATKRQLTKEARAGIDRCAGYLKKYKRYMRYQEALKAGTPIATGVIEGACRHLIADRFDITGARWSVKGAEAVLKIRALRSSGDFDAYWTFHREQEYERNHGSRYDGGVHPILSYPTKFENLRMVG